MKAIIATHILLFSFLSFGAGEIQVYKSSISSRAEALLSKYGVTEAMDRKVIADGLSRELTTDVQLEALDLLLHFNSPFFLQNSESALKLSVTKIAKLVDNQSKLKNFREFIFNLPINRVTNVHQIEAINVVLPLFLNTNTISKSPEMLETAKNNLSGIISLIDTNEQLVELKDAIATMNSSLTEPFMILATAPSFHYFFVRRENELIYGKGLIGFRQFINVFRDGALSLFLTTPDLQAKFFNLSNFKQVITFGNLLLDFNLSSVERDDDPRKNIENARQFYSLYGEFEGFGAAYVSTEKRYTEFSKIANTRDSRKKFFSDVVVYGWDIAVNYASNKNLVVSKAQLPQVVTAPRSHQGNKDEMANPFSEEAWNFLGKRPPVQGNANEDTPFKPLNLTLVPVEFEPKPTLGTKFKSQIAGICRMVLKRGKKK